MDRIDTSIEIDAPPAAVWAVLRDFDSYPEWNPLLRIAGRPNLGAHLRVELRPPGGRPIRFTPTVTAVERDRELRWVGHLVTPGLYDGEHVFRLEPLGDDRTRFVHAESFEGLLVRPINGLFGRRFVRGFEEMNEALERRVESLVAAGELAVETAHTTPASTGDDHPSGAEVGAGAGAGTGTDADADADATI
jgi:hypothetical protein